MPTVTSKTKKAHDEKFMQKRSGKSARIRPSINVDDVRKQYLENQENNYHAENAVLLAKHFGTKKEHEAALKSLEYRNKSNGYSSDDPVAMEHHKNSHAMHSKYWDHINEDYEGRKEEGKF